MTKGKKIALGVAGTMVLLGSAFLGLRHIQGRQARVVADQFITHLRSRNEGGVRGMLSRSVAAHNSGDRLGFEMSRCFISSGIVLPPMEQWNISPPEYPFQGSVSIWITNGATGAQFYSLHVGLVDEDGWRVSRYDEERGISMDPHCLIQGPL